MKKREIPTPKRVVEAIGYHPTTGNFWWKTSTGPGRKLGRFGHVCRSIGYLTFRLDGTLLLAHRAAFAIMTGDWPGDGLEVDHINGVRTDNRWRNLRLVTRREQRKNQKLDRRNKSGTPGVRWEHGGWSVRIGRDYLGRAKTLGEAVKMRRAAEIERNYHPNHGRDK